MTPRSRLTIALLLPSVLFVAAALAGMAPRAFAGDPPAGPVASAEAIKRLASLVERLRSTDVEVKKKALAEAKSEQDPSLLTHVKRLLTDADGDVRLAAVDVLAARSADAAKRQASEALAARIAALSGKPSGHVELLRILAVLHDLAQREALKPLLDGIVVEIDLDELAGRLKAVAAIPTPEAIDEIIQFGSRGRRGLDRWRRLSTEAFNYATGAGLGPDPDAWRAWWKDHEKGFDWKGAALRRKEDGGGPGDRKRAK